MDETTLRASDLFNAAIRCRDQGRHADAERLFLTGMERFPEDLDSYGHPRFRKELVRMLLGLRQWERAAGLYPPAGGPGGDHWPDILFARAYGAAGERDPEASWWLRIGEREPGNREFQAFLTVLAGRDPDQALSWLHGRSWTGGQHRAAHLVIAHRLFLAGRADGARLLDEIAWQRAERHGDGGGFPTPSAPAPGTAASPALDGLRGALRELGVKSVLLTNTNFSCWAGSQVVTRDLALMFLQAGVREVCLLTDAAAGDIASAAQERGVRIVGMRDDGWMAALPRQADLIWSHHWPLLGAALHAGKVDFRHLVVSSLSHFEPLEALVTGTGIADAVLAHSEENRQAQLQSLPPRAQGRLAVMPNSLPAHWFDDAAPPTALERLLVVSNHPPPELRQAAALLSDRGISVEVIGLATRQQEADAALIDSADAIVTIGHSVQKGLARRRPVYVYDRFGGIGWLSPERLDASERTNHSGRQLGARRPGHRIAEEILAGYAAALAQVDALHAEAMRRYTLEANVARVLGRMEKGKPATRAAAMEHRADHMVTQAYWAGRQRTLCDPVRNAGEAHLLRRTIACEATHGDDVRHLGVWIDGQRCPLPVQALDDVDSLQLAGTLVLADGAAAEITIERDDGLAWTAGWALPQAMAAVAANAGIDRSGPVNFFRATIALSRGTRTLDLWASHPERGRVPLCRLAVGDASPEAR